MLAGFAVAGCGESAPGNGATCTGVDVDLASEPDGWRDPAYVEWFRDGCLVRVDVITDRSGPEHCGWDSARVIVFGRALGEPFRTDAESVQYVRDRYDVFRAGLDEGLDLSAELPAAAVFTGYRSADGEELWAVPADDRFVYLALGDRVERWPRGEPPLCA